MPTTLCSKHRVILSMANIVKKKLKIVDMHCSSCVMSIDMDLEDQKGVKSVNTSYTKQETEVEFDEDQVNIQQLMETIKKTGYSAELKEKKLSLDGRR
ncbi:MAG: Heavy metal binding protein [Candidatus Daviesbacteria bacterium GW2011_GWA2_38_24]|uniref:Heavy metal binding protein n=1 Tax=Candidatus Daviesbacteria bacterium GW2011_GWA2_38_24 TaxID=1618422 RepID=A0A0G0JI18_9BACT|nr:MAG: Heavy metal binding protein [Candidatus Daviesbacteria bacterium GW2011_GWA2_38_24]KKQ80385.1 MAG: Heavy metal binding protein [Candidatus Daviesbacteria bacterium GW2011_GWA1_38_7]